MTECDSADDDMPPELEDMSETIAAARKMRFVTPRLASDACACPPCAPAAPLARDAGTFPRQNPSLATRWPRVTFTPVRATGSSERSPAVSAPKHDTALYSAVVDDPAKPDPVAAPLAADTRVRVSGLAKAAQYNGQSGVVKGFDHETRRYEVLLKSGKTLKIKRDNMELLDGAVKGGFLSQVRLACSSVHAFRVHSASTTSSFDLRALAEQTCKTSRRGRASGGAADGQEGGDLGRHQVTQDEPGTPLACTNGTRQIRSKPL